MAINAIKIEQVKGIRGIQRSNIREKKVVSLIMVVGGDIESSCVVPGSHWRVLSIEVKYFT